MKYHISLGLRGLKRHPRTMVLAIATMALGLAATMTMLTLLSILSSDPLPGVSQRLYLGWVDSREPDNQQQPGQDDDILRRSLWKWADVQAMREARPNIRQTALMATQFELANPEGSKNASGAGIIATGPMPSMFGVPLLHGRYWTPQEEQARTPVIIIDRDTSLRLLGDENGVGRDVRLAQGIFRVIGISSHWAPRPAAYFLQNGDNTWADLPILAMVPLQAALDAHLAPIGERVCDESSADGYRFDTVNLQACRWLSLWAELNDPTQVADFRKTLQDYASLRHQQGAFLREPNAGLHSMQQWLTLNHVVPDAVRLNLWLALALLGLCLVNVGSVLAARLLWRAGELGVRRVLGARRRDVVQQCLVESGLAGLIGGLLALPLTLFGLWVVRLQERGYTDMARFQPLLFLALLALALGCGLIVGLLPAWRAARLEPALQVKNL